MPYISKITLPSNTTYDIKDAEARTLIENLTSATKFLGISVTALTDGSTTTRIEIEDVGTLTAAAGDIAIYETSEFIFDGSTWHLFGDLSNLGDLAYKDSASGSFTPSGSVSQPTFTGSAKYLSATVGTASKTMSGSFTPTGEVSQPTFTGTQGSVSVSGTTAGTVATTYNTTSSGANGNFTPAGTVSAPTISVGTAGSTTTVKNPTSKTVVTDMSVAAPSETTASGELVYCSVSGETLSLQKMVETTGASITTANVTVKTGDASYTASAPTFTGTKIYAHHAFTGSSITSTGNFTPSGTVSQPTFTGVEGSVSVSGNIANTVTLATSTTTGTGKVDITPEGTVSKPTFSGTQGTVTVQ